MARFDRPEPEVKHQIALIVLIAAATGSAQAQPKPSITAASVSTQQPQGQAQPAPFANIPQLCQTREREVVGINLEIVARARAADAEKDPAKRSQIAAPLQNLRANLVQAESSWSRLDCARILYGAR